MPKTPKRDRIELSAATKRLVAQARRHECKLSDLQSSNGRKRGSPWIGIAQPSHIFSAAEKGPRGGSCSDLSRSLCTASVLGHIELTRQEGQELNVGAFRRGLHHDNDALAPHRVLRGSTDGYS
jgi:hypothetical protein